MLHKYETMAAIGAAIDQSTCEFAPAFSECDEVTVKLHHPGARDTTELVVKTGRHDRSVGDLVVAHDDSVCRCSKRKT